MDILIPLVALTAMEIVLGIDNIVFIAILVGRLPASQQPKARFLGLGLALVARILLLFSLSWILSLENPLFEITAVLEAIGITSAPEEVLKVSIRDLILLIGGLFLIWKSVREIHVKLEGGHEHQTAGKHASFGSVLAQIALLDVIFSLDSVITAVGMVDKDKLWVMVVAIIAAVIVMMVFAGSVSRFVDRHPTVKMLALSFLILIGVLLVAEGIGTHMNKGYIYFAMAFSLVVELLNMKVRGHAAKSPVASPE